MPFIFIKNNLKLMLRSKWILFLMLVLPIVTMGLISNAFQYKMNSSYHIDQFTIGYRLPSGSNYEAMMVSLQEACKDKDILLENYPEGEIEDLFKNQKMAAFVDISADGSYKIYQLNNKKTQGMITQSIFSTFFYSVNEEMTAQAYMMTQGIAKEVKSDNPEVTREKLDVDPVPSAIDYYGIIYLVYFAWTGMVALVAVISSERKSAIPQRLKVAQISRIESYMAKWIPCSLATLINICITWVASVLLYHIHWGELGLSFCIIVLISLAASAFGLVLFQIFRHVAISIVVEFIIIWIFGFFGGTFEAYMYLGIPDYLIKSSPLYYINHTLVDYSIKGYSDYTGICFGILAGIIIGCGIIGTLLINRRMEA